MARPQISDDFVQVVKEMHKEETGTRPGSFEEALETVIQLADQALGDDGWYPGKYAGKAFERVLGKEESTSTGRKQMQQRSSPTPQSSVVDPDRQAVFKQVLEDDYTITVPEPEWATLDLTPGEVLQVIAYPAGSPESGSTEDKTNE
jgi:hypothetical protein